MSPGMSPAKNILSTDCWASDLSIVMRTRSGNGLVEGFVLDAKSGEPVANAKVRAWTRDRNVRREVAPTTSDDNGRFKFPAINRGYLILASKGITALCINYSTERSPKALR